MAMLSVTTILLLALLASIAFPRFRTALIWLTVAIIAIVADLHRRFGPGARKPNQRLLLFCGLGSLGATKGLFGVLPELIGHRHGGVLSLLNPVPTMS